MKDFGELNYFLGFEATRTDQGLCLTQSKYATDLLAKTKMSDCSSCLTPMSPGAKLTKADGEPFSDPTLYMSTIGAL